MPLSTTCNSSSSSDSEPSCSSTDVDTASDTDLPCSPMSSTGSETEDTVGTLTDINASASTGQTELMCIASTDDVADEGVDMHTSEAISG